MNKALIALLASLSLLAAPSHAEDDPAVVDALSGYMDFAEYGSSLIWPEQIPREDWKKVFIVDARDAAQCAGTTSPALSTSTGGRPWRAAPNCRRTAWW